MKKGFSFYILISAISVLSFLSCRGKSALELMELKEGEKIHSWFYFTDAEFSGIKNVDLPANVPAILKKPWTEAVRISSAASVPGRDFAFAIVNRRGVLRFSEDGGRIYKDPLIFDGNTADSMVFSSGIPVFYLYRSTFFNSLLLSENGQNQGEKIAAGAELSRPFLVEFNPRENVTFPLVSYSNIGLSNQDQVTGYFWDGDTWACSAKTIEESENIERVQFKYFKWKSEVAITDLQPNFNSSFFISSKISESDYRKLKSPKLFKDAPGELKKLLKNLPSDFSFYVKWRDESGTSPFSYYNEGSSSTSLNAEGAVDSKKGFSYVVFQDGTTYLKIKDNEGEQNLAFRLPRLPSGFKYGEAAVCKRKLYVAWEESNFYMTGRSGFIQVDIDGLLERLSAI